jgi:hypothetical protein
MELSILLDRRKFINHNGNIPANINERLLAGLTNVRIQQLPTFSAALTSSQTMALGQLEFPDHNEPAKLLDRITKWILLYPKVSL